MCYNKAMKKYFLALLLPLLFLPTFVFAVSNSGFIPGQIWFSKDSLKEGEIVNIHTAVWNGEDSSISTKVEFYDKNTILGSRDVILTPLSLKDVSISWKVTQGEHIISAKITSSTITIDGKKENVALSTITTSNNKVFIPVTVKDSDGNIVSGQDKVQTQIQNTGDKISSMLPENVNSYISDSFNSIEDFREKTSDKVSIIKDDTQVQLDELNKQSKDSNIKITTKTNIDEATKKPITYIKLFIFSILSFVFSNKIAFYLILLFLVFYVLRFIFRKIRNR